MTDYKYIIIGGGMTAESAVQGIRQLDQDGSIGVLSAEPHMPYDRPPLSKGLWKGAPLDKIWRAKEGLQADWLAGHRAEELIPDEREVLDDQGNTYHYEKLLIATGGSPRQLPFGGDDVIYFRTVDDFERLHALSDGKSTFAVIGGGFIGSEIAAALTMAGNQVIMTFPEPGIGSAMFPEELSSFLNEYYEGEKGVQLLPGYLVTGLSQTDNGWEVSLQAQEGGEDKSIEVKAVVAGLGIDPNIELAQATGLEFEDGIVVDEQLRTHDANVYAAGDVASFYNPLLDKRIRVEHEDNANVMGQAAGRNMAGASESFDYLPSYYSDLFDYGYEAVGELSSSMSTYMDWEDPFKKGVIYYMENDRVRGVLLWDVWGQLDAAREVIAETGPVQPESLKGRIQSE